MPMFVCTPAAKGKTKSIHLLQHDTDTEKVMNNAVYAVCIHSVQQLLLPGMISEGFGISVELLIILLVLHLLVCFGITHLINKSET